MPSPQHGGLYTRMVQFAPRLLLQSEPLKLPLPPSSSPAALWRDRLRRAGCMAVLLVILLILQSVSAEARVPWLLRLAVVIIGVVSAVRPPEGLMLVAALVPFGHVFVTTVWPAAYPYGATESFVLAFLAGVLTRDIVSSREHAPPIDAVTVAVWSLAVSIAASCLVQLGLLQIWHDYPVPFARAFFTYIAREYLTATGDPRPWVDGRGVFNLAVFALEGLALMLYARRICSADRTMAARVLRTVVIAGVIAATMSVISLWSIAGERGQSVLVLLREMRWSFAIPSVNTSGPYFMLVAFLAVVEALTSRSRGARLAWWFGAVLAVAAMAMTHTRSSIVSGLALSLAVLIWTVAMRKSWPPVRTVAFAALAAIVVAIVVVFVNPFGLLPRGSERSIGLRMISSMTAVHMAAAHPWFGVGIGQYALNRAAFTAPEELALFPAPDPHNYFAFVAAELGLVGFVAFLGLIVAVLAILWRALREWSFDVRLLVGGAGLTAFIVTWISGQPVAIPQVGYTFWIVAGAMMGFAAHAREPRPVPKAVMAFVTLAAVVILASVPSRVATFATDIDRSRVWYGFSGWENDAAGGRFRWTGRRATFHMREDTRVIDVTMSAARPAGVAQVTVNVMVNGRAVDRMALTGSESQTVRLTAPADTGPYWRIDLAVSPTWVPADHIEGNPDTRQLGILVHEPVVITRRSDTTGATP